MLDVVIRRKVKMYLWLDDKEEYDVYISHTKVKYHITKKIMN